MTQDRVYAWRRHWLALDELSSLERYGWLADPTSESAAFFRGKGQPLVKLHEKSCLVLLGDPGMGKTTSVRQDIAEFKQDGATACCLDLADYGSLEELTQAFRDDPAIRAWVDGTHILHLFLDGLDEIRIMVKVAARRVARELKHLAPHAARLRTRVVCRGADWPSMSLEKSLKDIFGSKSVTKLRLAPLTTEDVRMAAEAEGADPDRFLEACRRAEVLPLAARPVTLRFLLSAFDRHAGTLPSGRVDLYRAGLLDLCAYRGEFREAAALPGRLTREQRYRAASWLAAAAFLSGRSRFNVAGQGSGVASVLHLDDLGGNIPYPHEAGGSLNLDPELLREVVDTGIFEAATGGIRFAHRTYQEVLAADFLAVSSLPDDQILALLVSSGGYRDTRIAPQMRELAAWVAAMRPSFGKKLIQIDPATVLLSDFLLDADDEPRCATTEVLLGQYIAGHLSHDAVSFTDYGKLNHSTLANQLNPVLRMKSEDNGAKSFAIGIADVATVQGAAPALADLTLNPSEPLWLRARAADALLSSGGPAEASRLLPLLDEIDPSTSDDASDLYYNTLRLAWRHQKWTLPQLFTKMTEHAADSRGGSRYRLLEELNDALDDSAVPAALAWVKHRDPRRDGTSPAAQRLGNRIITRAIDRINDADVRRALAELAVARAKGHSSLIEPEGSPRDAPVANLFSEPGARRAVIDAVVGWWVRRPVVASQVWVPRDLSDREDFVWLLRGAMAESGKRRRAVRLLLARRVFDIDNSDHVTALVAAGSSDQSVRDVFVHEFRVVDPFSDEADDLREQLSFTIQRRRPQAVRTQDRIGRAIAHRAANVQAGRGADWGRLLKAMSLKTDGTHDEHWWWDRDLCGLSGWKRFPEHRDTVIRAAVKRLHDEPRDYVALLLVWRYRRSELDAHDEPNWDVWTTEALRARLPHQSEETRAAAQELLTTLYRRDPDGFIAAADRLMADDVAKNGRTSLIDELLSIADDRLGRHLLEKSAKLPLSADGRRSAFSALFETEVAGAEELVASRLPADLASDSEETRSEALETAVLLHQGVREVTWLRLRPLLDDDGFARDLITRAGHTGGFRSGKLLDHIPEAELEWWATRLIRLFPLDTDPARPNDGESLPDRYWAARYRDDVFSKLAGRGTEAALASIANLTPLLGESYSNWVGEQAREAARERNWRRLDPADLRTLVADTSRVLLRDARELQAAVLDSLRQLEQKLQGETPAAEDLWNVNGSRTARTYHPKDEETLSNYVARHLRDDLKRRAVSALREVQIRRGGGGTPGEQTDVYVSAAVAHDQGGPPQVVTVIIEVKGCWFNNLLDSVESQLANRYLRDNNTRHGVFLLGWFGCAAWDEEDYRKADCRQQFSSLDDARRRLQEETERVSKSTGLAIEPFVLRCNLA